MTFSVAFLFSNWKIIAVRKTFFSNLTKIVRTDIFFFKYSENHSEHFLRTRKKSLLQRNYIFALSIIPLRDAVSILKPNILRVHSFSNSKSIILLNIVIFKIIQHHSQQGIPFRTQNLLIYEIYSFSNQSYITKKDFFNTKYFTVLDLFFFDFI